MLPNRPLPYKRAIGTMLKPGVQQLVVQLPLAYVHELNKLAEKRNCTVTSLIRQIMLTALLKEKTDPAPAKDQCR
jgi:hypothetical protein